MPNSQSSEPGFESLFTTVSKIGYFRSLHWRPSSLSGINEYLAIDSGGNMSDLVFARNCCMVRMLPGEAELVSEWTGLPGKAKSVKRFERSNGLYTALYKNYLFLTYIILSGYLELFVSTVIPFSHSFVSQFGLAIFLWVKNSQNERKNRMFSWSPGRRRNGDNLNGDNCGHNGDRLSQNGDNESLYHHDLKSLV